MDADRPADRGPAPYERADRWRQLDRAARIDDDERRLLGRSWSPRDRAAAAAGGPDEVTLATVARVDVDSMTDATLVRRVLDGDPRAFTLLVDRHLQPCLRFATRMLGSRHDAEDATQEALLRAYRALATYDPGSSFRTWLFAILVNRCRTALLQRSRYVRRVVTDGDAMQSATVADGAISAELRIEIARALAQLDPEQREAFLL